MKIKLFAFLAIVAFYASVAHADIQDDVALISRQLNEYSLDFDKNNSDDLKKEIISKNIGYLESFVLKAIKKTKLKIEKNKKNYSNLETEMQAYRDDYFDDSDYYSEWLEEAKANLIKKNEALETRIISLQELLFGIQFLKLRIGC